MSFGSARFLCAILLVCACSFVKSNGELLSIYSEPVQDWVVSPTQQKQWWGRWPGACGALKCSDSPNAYGDTSGLRFLLDMYGNLKWDNLPDTGKHKIGLGNCSDSLGLAMSQRFASYQFSCGASGFAPDPTNGPCPDMQLKMHEMYPSNVCLHVNASNPAGSPRYCTIANNKVECTDEMLCNNDLDFSKPLPDTTVGEYMDYETDATLQTYCVGPDPVATSNMDYIPGVAPVCYETAVPEKCGAAYLAFGKYENAEAGNPPCDKDGDNVEPGKGAGKNTGRCALPCVTYRAFDERYWADAQSFCPCLSNQNMLPSALRENNSAPARASKFRYFLYHTEFALGFDAAGTLRRHIKVERNGIGLTNFPPSSHSFRPRAL